MKDVTALEAAQNLLGDVNSLLDHHPAQKDPKPGKPAGPGYGPLLRAGTSLCYTAWEVYVEESLIETVEWLLENKEADELPKKLRSWVVEQRRDPWVFVGDSWRSTVLELVRSRIEGDSEGRYGFNTASVGGVESLYGSILDFCPLREIKWQKKANASVRKQISDLVKIRGEIVHRGSTPDALNLGQVRNWADFVRRLIEKFDERMVEFRLNV
uniref:HEPN domain-containing protein n=1 Tax=Tessaracoccus timonensis TaxID=2161816 RepID=UPI000D55BC07|nr:HEPN domain-containing protein [Tessaracoccus timonensis]